MTAERILFEKIKENRGDFFVEYLPADGTTRFANLNLVFPDSVSQERAAELMEAESRAWMNRFPVPLMVASFDGTGSLIYLTPAKESNFLICFEKTASAQLAMHWKLLKDEELPSDALNCDFLKRVYSGISVRTQQEVRQDCEQQRKKVSIVKWAFLLWALVPLAILILGETSIWVSRMVFAFSFFKIVIGILNQSGVLNKSKRQLEKEKEAAEMRHCYYHCKLNPERFMQLRSENLQREATQQIRKEADALKQRS